MIYLSIKLNTSKQNLYNTIFYISIEKKIKLCKINSNFMSLLSTYQKDSCFYDEIFFRKNEAHPFSKYFVEEFDKISLQDIKMADNLSHQFFLNEGITFTTYDGAGDVGGKIFPMDIIPRVMSAKDWDFLERGLTQRIMALNCFLKDIYSDEKIIKDKIIPQDLIYESPHFLKEMKNTPVPFDVYVNLCGTDIVRTEDGFFVLEDNLRVPSGSSYMLMCRQVMKQKFLHLFRKCNVKKVDDYPLRLLKSLKQLSKKEDPTIVLLTPGVFNSAYFEHVFLANQMGIELVQGQDLLFNDNAIYIKNIKQLKKVDVIYRRIDDIFLDPITFRSDSVLGVPGLFSAYKTGSVVIANAPGTGVADDKAVYTYIPEIIKYYLNEDPLLQSVPTYRCRDKKDLQYTLENLENLVVKPVGGSGGYGLIIGPKSSKKEIEDYKKKLKENPKNFTAQPVLGLSTSPCFIDNAIQSRHVDLRPFVLFNKDFTTNIVPGGLCRVALKKGSLVVNSSQGGGSKDIWVLNDN